MPRTILIVDDELMNREILANMLNKDYVVLTAESGESALNVIRSKHSLISAVLLDLKMPRMDGFDVIKAIRSDLRFRSIPIIVVTALTDLEAEEKAVSLGAYGFVTKPYKSVLIKHHLKNAISYREAAALQNIIRRDDLTKIMNVRGFTEQAEALIKSQPRGYYVMSCFDIDSFKIINDQYGTDKGDAVLRHIAETLNECFVGIGGICGRISSDDFAALYPSVYLGSDVVKECYRQAVSPACISRSVSMRIGRYIVEDKYISVSAMYDRAVLAKESIKGKFDVHEAVYDDAMRDRLLHEQQIVSDMGRALTEHQFEVWYQPQYNHATGALIGAEALVRWRHPERGLISPLEFIPIFERNGFIYSLDKYIWEQVCFTLRKWINQGRNPMPVSVNLSRRDIAEDDLTEVLSGLLLKYDIPVSMLRLEITESAFAESAELVASTVKRLVEKGFTVEIDDFGSGYSSLNTLKDVPAQVIKLDMKFLHSTMDSQRGGNIVESIVRMAKWLGMSVIAEGVETLKQADYLRSIGCNYMQGFLYAKPMPAEKYEQHCSGSDKEERLLALETVENLDNNLFWDPESIDTLIFNSFVGGACIYEYHRGKIELIRATDKYARMLGGENMTNEDALRINWEEHLEEQSLKKVLADIEESAATRAEVTGEYVFLNLPGCPQETYLRSSMRVIASAGERYLVYCTNENITAQRKAEQHERDTAERLQAVMDNVNCGISAVTVSGEGVGLLLANDRYYDIIGYSREEFAAEISSMFDVVHPDDLQRVLKVTKNVNKIGNTATVEFRVVRRDKKAVWVKGVVSTHSFDGVDSPVQVCAYTDITAERQAESELRAAAAQIQNMMDDIPGGFVRMSVLQDGGIKPVYMNDGFVRLMGMSRDKLMDIYADNAFAEVHPDDVGMLTDAVSEMLKNGAANGIRYRLLHGSGSYIWLSVSGRVTTDASGNTFLNIFYTDASERVRQDEAQKELLDNLPGGAGIYEFRDGQMSLKYQNKSFWELVGLGGETFPDPTPMSAVHPDDVKIIMHELASAIEQGRDVVCDIRLRHLTKGYRPVQLAGRIVQKDGGGFLIYATFTPNDRDGLSYQQMLPVVLSAIMGSTTDLSFAKDTNFRYLICSRAFANLVGMESESDVVGKTDYELFDADMADKFRRDDEALLESGKALIDMTESIPSHDGSPRYASTSKYLLRDGSGVVAGLYGVGRDITESVIANTQLQTVNNSVPGGLVTYACKDGETRMAYFNNGFCRLIGATREELMRQGGVDLLSRIHEEDRAKVSSAMLALVQDDAPVDCVFRIRTADGSFKWINEKANSAERQGDTVLFNAILLDVTEYQNALERLRISEEESNLAARLSGNTIGRFSIEERTLTLQSEAAAVFSLPQIIKDVPYGPVRSGLIAPDSTQLYTAFFEAIINGSKASNAVYQQNYFGEWRWIDAKSTTIFTDDGKPVKAMIAFRDVTDNVERETVYKKWQQSLHDRPKDSYTLYRCNISSNSGFDSTEGGLLTVKFKEGRFNFNERTAEYAEKYVYKDDAMRFSALLNADALLADFYQGNRVLAIEYRELFGDGVRWLRLSVDLVDSAYTNDVDAYLLFEDIDESKRLELQIKERSETDPLTGLLNRTTFAAKVNDILRSSEPGDRHAMLMIDVDGFKQVNDIFGHAAGDSAIIDIAKSLRAVLRHNDLVARLGGDEFVVFLTSIPEARTAVSKAKHICALVRRSFSLEVSISGSVGIAVSPKDGTDFDSLYKNADCALYYVKGSGKDSFAFYHSDMADEILTPETDLCDSGCVTQLPEKKQRMLVVGGEATDIAMLQSIFCSEFIVEKATDGSSALERLGHYGRAVSIVLLDLTTQDTDRLPVLEKMQKSAELQSIPVIVVSGDENREVCLKAIRAGATDIITKPVDADLLRVRVRSAISSAESEQLRAKNSLLEMQNSEKLLYEAALEGAGITFVELDRRSGVFAYHPTLSKYIAGKYDDRPFWQILLSDSVADALTVQTMQRLVSRVAKDTAQACAGETVRLKTPEGAVHSFRMTVRNIVNKHRLADMLFIALNDLEYEVNNEN